MMMASTNGTLKQATRPLVRDLIPPVWPLPLEDLGIHFRPSAATDRLGPGGSIQALGQTMAGSR